MRKDQTGVSASTLQRILYLLVAGSITLSGQEMFPVVWETFEYPLLGVQARITGDVELRVVANRDGEVTRVEAVAGHSVLVDVAAAAIKKWRFGTRCKREDTPPEVSFSFRITFKLDGVAEGRPRSQLKYVQPLHLIVTSQAVRYQPAPQEPH